MQNLTDSIEIKHHLEKIHGYGSLAKFAEIHGYSIPYVSQTIKGDRANETVLKRLASYAGCRIHGVFPGEE